MLPPFCWSALAVEGVAGSGQWPLDISLLAKLVVDSCRTAGSAGALHEDLLETDSAQFLYVCFGAEEFESNPKVTRTRHEDSRMSHTCLSLH